MAKAVHWYCSSCLTCAKCKSRRKPKTPLHPIPTGNPMQRIHIDIVGPLPRSRSGKRYILTVQCSFTKWDEAFAIPNQRATTCARVLVKIWCVDMVCQTAYTVIREETSSPRSLRKCAICWRSTKRGQLRTTQRAINRLRTCTKP